MEQTICQAQSGIHFGAVFWVRDGVMSAAIDERARSYPPDYVSAETLAYRLDCKPSEIDALVRSGALPRAVAIGPLKRWDFVIVRAFLAAQTGSSLPVRAPKLAANGRPGSDADPYLMGVERGAAG